MMKKILKIIIMAVSATLAMFLFGNLLVHFLFYLIDGNMGKFLSPVWMAINGIMVFFCVVFGFTLRNENG